MLQAPVSYLLSVGYHGPQEPGTHVTKAVIDIGSREFTSSLSFVAVSRVHSIEDLLFKPFNFERLQRIKDCKRLGERKDEEEKLLFLMRN